MNPKVYPVTYTLTGYVEGLSEEEAMEAAHDRAEVIERELGVTLNDIVLHTDEAEEQ